MKKKTNQKPTLANFDSITNQLSNDFDIRSQVLVDRENLQYPDVEEHNVQRVQDPGRFPRLIVHS